jgi:hypothetical protein
LQSVLFAILLSVGPITVLAHGFAGTGSTITGLLMAVPTAALLLLARWREFTLDLCDVFFSFFCCAVALSFAANGVTAPKEALLLGLSLAAYPAARLGPRSGAISTGFIVVTGAVVTISAIVTVVALLDQWNDNHGKPLVFGEYDAAPAQFTIALGFLVLALASKDLNWRKTAVISLLSALPIAIFAASIVRYSFIVMMAALVAATLVVEARQRKFIVAIMCAVIISVATGALVRSSTTIKFVRHAGAVFVSDAPGASCTSVDKDNSIAIRQQLYKEAFALLPVAGLTGLGLDGFGQRACMKGFHAHNSILQAIIEFGWPAGIFLILMIGSAMGKRMFSLARINSEARFVLCSLVFTLMLSMAHGRISRDAPLFLFLGYAAKIRSRALEIEEQAWIVNLAPSKQYPAPQLAAVRVEG